MLETSDTATSLLLESSHFGGENILVNKYILYKNLNKGTGG